MTTPPEAEREEPGNRDAAAASPVRIGAQAATGAIAVTAVAFALWRVRKVLILLLLALTLAAAIRPGVEALQRRRIPQSLAILIFFVFGVGVFVLFFWLAVPPALHQLQEALASAHAPGSDHTTGFQHDVLSWVDRQLRHLPSGSSVLHPIATYGHKATEAIVAVLFTLAATWYWVSERDSAIEFLVALSPEQKRERVRQTYLAIDERLGAYTRLKFMMVFVIGAVLATGFYLVGLNYWLLLGGFVSLLEIIPVIGPAIGSLLVVAVGLTQSLHVALLALLVVVAVREFQSYVINPHLMGRSVGLSPLVTLVSVSVVGLLFGSFAVVLAIPAVSAAATLIDVLVLEREPAPPERRSFRLRRPPSATQD